MCRGDHASRLSTGAHLSDQFYADVVGVGRERLKIRFIPGKHGASRFRKRDDQSINGGSTASLPAKLRCPAGNLLAYRAVDQTGLEEAVRARVAGRMALEAFHEHNGGNHRGPQLRRTQ